MESLSLIDFSSEDNLLISSFDGDGLPEPLIPGLTENCEHNFVRSEAVSIHEEIRIKISRQMEQIPELSKSPEHRQTKSGKYNLRKSLAWDNAFFTSEGVLNTEELAIVNSTFRKAEVRMLPGIQEDVRKSTESTSTLDGDSWALENLEVDLFENLRASIQKSLGKGDKASTSVHSNKKVEQGELDAPRLRPSKVGPSQNKMKPPIALRRPGVVKQQSEDTSKESLNRVKVAVRGGGDSKSSLKPPRIAPGVASLPTVPLKKASASRNVQIISNDAKGLSGNVGNRQSVVVKKNGESCSTPRSIPSPKFDVSSVSSSSDSSSKSTLDNSTKRSARYTDHPSSAETPLRILKSRIGSRNANDLPTRLKSASKLSSGVSPSSSVDSLVSEYSSSNSVATKPSNSIESIDASSSISPSQLVSLDKCVPRPSDLRKLSIDRSRSCIGSSSGSNLSKPSGLRMPTPKIGYFDAEKTVVRSSNKFSHSGLQSSLPRNTTGISNIIGANKPKPSKLHCVRPAGQNVMMNSDSPHARTTLRSARDAKPASPTSSRRLSKPSQPRGTPRITKDHDLCSKVDKDLSPITIEVGPLKVLEVEAGVAAVAEHCQLSKLPAEERLDQSNPKPMIGILSGNRCEFSGEANYDLSHKGSESSHQKGDTEGREHTLWLSYIKEGCMQSSQNENLFPADNTNSLSGHLQTENRNMSMVELMGRRISALSLSETKDVNPGGDSGSSSPHLMDPIPPEQKLHVLQSSSGFSSLSVDLEPNARTPLVDKFLQ